MRIEEPLLEATLVARENRFRAMVLLEDREVSAHVPNSGRLAELLLPGRPVLLREAGAPRRVTDYDLLMVRLPQRLVCVDARLPNSLFAEAIRHGALSEFQGLGVARQELVLGNSRLDFLLANESSGEVCVVEVKSVTLVQGGVARFPDAITQRGKRHLVELRRVFMGGKRAAAVFVIQRDDARLFAPHWDSDAAFGEMLYEVAGQGVEVYAYGCQVDQHEIYLRAPVPVALSRYEAGGRRA